MRNITYQAIKCELIGAVGHIQLNNPTKYNAMDMTFFNDFPLAISEMENADEVRAIILTSTSDNFCSGLDLDVMSEVLQKIANTDPDTAESYVMNMIQSLQLAISSVAECVKPVIAAVNGSCIGGGLDLIASCDIRLCSHDATFAIRETKLAMVADLGSLQRLPAIIGRGFLSELALTGRDFDSDFAKRIGLVNDVFPSKETLISGAIQLATDIAENSPSAIEGVKRAINEFYDSDLDDHLEFVASLNFRQIQSKDIQKIISSVLKNRASS